MTRLPEQGVSGRSIPSESESERRVDVSRPRPEVTFTAGHFSGPIPPPPVLEAYDRIHAGLADRIVRIAEREQSHQHGVENTQLQLVGRQQGVQSRAQVSATVISIVGLLCGSGLVLYGAPTIGVCLLLVQASATFMAVIRGRKPKEADKASIKT